MAISMGGHCRQPQLPQKSREQQQQMLAGEDEVANAVAEIEARLIRD